jgi:sugar transferase (PEP-CTERM/EpsH1 system associated)
MKDGQATAAPVTVGHTIYAFRDGGMERGVLNIVNYGDRDRFHHVILCLTQAGSFASQLTSPACEVIELHKREGNDLRLPGRIAAAARRHHVDILHARGWPTLVETVLAARLAGVRATIYGFHGKTIEEIQGLGPLRRWVQKGVIRCYQRVVTLNCGMRADLAVECSLPEDRIQIIANGVDVDIFRPREDRCTLRAAFGLPVDRFIIGNVARLDPVKNHEVILRALHRLRAHQPTPFFLLIGEGHYRSALEREVERLGLSADVRLFGYSERIPELLNCLDLYIQSSFYEGFSNTVIEAMACGMPVLATDVGGTTDLFAAGQHGFFFHPEDDQTLAALIIHLQQDGALRRAMADRARRHVVEHFSVDTMVRSYEAMYLELASLASRRRK